MSLLAAVALLAALSDIAADAGYPLIFLIVMVETGLGIPFAPGELATVFGGIAAAEDKLALELVILFAAAGAIVGDNIGYVIGWKGGRRLLEREGAFYKQRQQVLAIADPFFEKHGGKAVLIGRWLPVLRVYASWLAGASKMQWRTFFFWNAVGGTAWAVSMAVLGYYGGAAAARLIEDLGKYGVVIVVIGAIGAFFAYRHQQKRAEDWVRRESQEFRAITRAEEAAAAGKPPA
jgi:membrane protein DedA with SNARE-associated domain